MPGASWWCDTRRRTGQSPVAGTYTGRDEVGNFFAKMYKTYGDTLRRERHATVLRGGHALHPTGTATSIRRNDSGGVIVTDGAFAETKETLGGYYVIEAADLDEALVLATQVPAPFGGVEVRPVRTFD
ncbi:MAG: YciI family protein [Pseudonocardiaceae bacterium]